MLAIESNLKCFKCYYDYTVTLKAHLTALKSRRCHNFYINITKFPLLSHLPKSFKGFYCSSRPIMKFEKVQWPPPDSLLLWIKLPFLPIGPSIL